MWRSAKVVKAFVGVMEFSGADFSCLFATGFSIVSVSAECIVKDYGARWVLQVKRVVAPAVSGGRISVYLPLRTAAATPFATGSLDRDDDYRGS